MKDRKRRKKLTKTKNKTSKNSKRYHISSFYLRKFIIFICKTDQCIRLPSRDVAKSWNAW